jgi:hypothetical protein
MARGKKYQPEQVVNLLASHFPPLHTREGGYPNSEITALQITSPTAQTRRARQSASATRPACLKYVMCIRTFPVVCLSA